MANLISLALKINADASGVKFDPLSKALDQIGKEVDKVTSVFDKFTANSEAAVATQQRFADQLNALTAARQAGTIGAKEFAESFAAISEAAKGEAASLERAARITEENISPIQRYEARFQELVTLLREGKITQETYNAAVEKARTAYNNATGGAKSFGDAVAGQTLKFNELSGIFAALPGPLGNIAGRFSGLASAGEGLSRIFSGGLTQGLSGIVTTVAGLINPFTLAAGSVAAFGAASVTVARGLIALEDRVEKLGNTADKLGVSFGFIQTLEEAARRSGSSIDAVSSAFGRLQKNVLGVDEESKTARAALEEIGITAEQLQALAPDEQYLAISRAIAGIEDPARRTATAIALFGKSGADLVPVFKNIRGAADDFGRVGAALNDGQRRNIDEFGNAMDRLAVAASGAGQQIYASFAPAGTVIASSLAEATGAVAKFIEDRNKAADFTAELQTLRREYYGTVTDEMLSLLKAGETAEQVLKRVAAQADISKTTGRWLDLRDAAVEAASGAANFVSQTEQLTEEEQKQAAGREKFLQRFADDVSRAISESAKFGKAGFDAALKYQDGIDQLRRNLDAGILNDTSFAQEAEKVRAAFNSQFDVIKQSAADVDAIMASVDGLLAKAQEIPQLEQDINAVEAEIARVQAKLIEARAAGDQAQIDGLTARIGRLDQLQAQLAEQSDQAAQGFADGFGKAFQQTNNGISSLIDKAAEFGQEGFNAALQLQDGIAKAQAQVKDGILNKEAYAAEEARQKKLFEDRISALQKAEQVGKQIAERQQGLADKQFELDLERARELATVKGGSIQVNDLRNGGISAFFATLKEDPAIAEAKKQTKELQKIRDELAKLQAERVDILAGAG